MSVLLALALCLCVSVANATTVVGTIKDAGGVAVPTGTKVHFILSQEATAGGVLYLGPPTTVICSTTSGAIAALCVVQGNETLSPAGTYYRVRIVTINGGQILPERRYTITGTTWDIGANAPQPADVLAATSYNQILDEGVNVIRRNKLNIKGAGASCVDVAASDWTECTFSGGGAGSTHQIDAMALTSQDPINFLDTSEFDWTNPAAGNLSLALKAAGVADSKLASNYSGVGSCTNQFARALNDNAAPTCATVTSADTSGTFAATAHNLLSATHGDTAAASAVLGDLLFGNSTPAWARLAGNITTAKQFLTQTGTGSVSAAPAWGAIADADVPSTLTRDSEVNVQGTASEVISSGSGPAPTLSLDATVAQTDIAKTFTALQTFRDTTLELTDDGDTSKKLSFQLSAISTTTTRTWTAPNASGEVSLLGQTIEDAELASNYSGVGSCTNQFPRALNDNAAPTCATVTSADTSGTFAPDAHALVGATHSASGLTAGQVVRATAATTFAWQALPIGDTSGDLAASRVDDGGAAATQALFSGAAGAAGFRALAAGDLPNLESLNGTLDVASGGTGAAPGADDQVLVSDSTSAATWRTVPACNTVTEKTFYNPATNTWSCEADAGAGGGAPVGVQYVVGASDATLTAEKILTDGQGIDTVLTGTDAGAATIDLKYTDTLAGNPAFDAGEVVFSDDCPGGGFLSEGTTANTNEMLYCFPALDEADTTHTLVTLSATQTVTGKTLTAADNVIEADTGDSATAFFSAGTVEADRLPNLESLNGTLDIASGGTGATTSQGAINALSQLTTNGDLLYHNGTNSTRLPRGTDTQCLTANATTILWGSCGGGGGDNLRVEDGDNAGTFTAMVDADFDDSGDINFARAAGPPDVLTATIRADSVALATDTTGDYAASITAGAGLASSGATSGENISHTLSTASGEADFLASGALTCGAATRGKAQVHTTPLQYCDNAGTPALQYAAYGASDGDALAGDSATSFFDTGTLEDARLSTNVSLLGQTIGTAEIIDANVTPAKLSAAAREKIVSMVVLSPTTSLTNLVQHKFAAAVTILRVSCSIDTGTSTTIQLDERAEATPNTAGTNVLTASLVCDTNTEATTTFTNATIAADVPLNLQITAQTGTPNVLRIHVDYTVD